MIRLVFITILFASFFVAGCSQKQKNQTEGSPYTGQENREIKALSSKEISGYQKGKGMGFAKVAELNHYPGPKHIMDLSEQIELTEEQQQAVDRAFRRMKNEAQNLGQRLIKKEKQLDEMFANEKTSKKQVKALVQKIGKLKADLRFAHVRAHLEMKKVLTPAQVEQYDQLRGYGQAGNHRKHNTHGTFQ